MKLAIAFWGLALVANNEAETVELLTIAATRISSSEELSFKEGRNNCSFVLLWTERTNELSKHKWNFCLLSDEEVFLYGVKSYLILDSVDVKQGSALLEITLVQPATGVSVEKSTEFRFSFSKDIYGQWKLK